jgi:hypothetical protein
MNTLPLLTLDRAEVYPDRATWEAGRTATPHRIGASIVGTILTRPWEALETLTGQAPEPDRATKIAWARGHLYESAIIGHYGLLTERPAAPIGDAIGHPGALVIVVHATDVWACASPDGGAIDEVSGPGLIEAKDYVGGDWAHEDLVLRSVDDYAPDMAPSHILTQCYWQMECSDVAWVDIARRTPSGGLRIIRVCADAATQREILDTVGEWRERHLVHGEPLPVDGSDACTRLLTRRFPGSTDKALRPADADEAAMVRRYAATKEEIKRLDATADEIRNLLAERIGDAYGLSLGGKEKVLLIPMKGRETVSLTEIAQVDPELSARLAAYVHRGAPYRQLRAYGLD